MAYLYRMFPGNRIRYYRKRARISQAKLGEKIGTHQTHVSNMENGDRSLTIEWARRIAKVFGVAVADLLEDADNPDRLTDEERELVALHRQASEAERATIRRVAQAVTPFTAEPPDIKKKAG